MYDPVVVHESSHDADSLPQGCTANVTDLEDYEYSEDEEYDFDLPDDDIDNLSLSEEGEQGSQAVKQMEVDISEGASGVTDTTQPRNENNKGMCIFQQNFFTRFYILLCL